MDVAQLHDAISNSALAFRGYNVTNLGRSRELLLHPQYGEIIHSYLREASSVCAKVVGRRINLVDRVRRGRETTLRSYPDAIALIVALELAQLRVLQECFGIPYASAKFSFGYSLGEITALVAGGVMQMQEALEVPLTFARDCVRLAKRVTLGVLFSREAELPLDEIQRQCLLVNREGQGVVGLSAYLTPNSVLVMGQDDTLDRLMSRLEPIAKERLYLRKNRDRWPPLHTPIIWKANIPCRAAVKMHLTQGGFAAPQPPVFSLVTGRPSYNDINCREILRHWTDHPQRLWDAICEILEQGIRTVIHVGPAPNIIPATLQRLRDNVEAQTQGSIGMRALSVAVSRPWLKALLPQRTTLLRITRVRQLVLEDWLLDEGRVAPDKVEVLALR